MKRVLLVEKNDHIRFLLLSCLLTEGYVVFTVANGEAAETLLLTEPFDFVLINAKLPLISGTQVLKNIRDKGIMTPVVIIAPFSIIKSSIVGAKDRSTVYLQNPFNSKKVREAISELDKAK